MNCKEALELTHEVLDGAASAEASARLREHLSACASCAREYERLAHCDGLLRAPDPEEPGDAYFDAMARSIRFETRKRERQPAGALVPRWAFSWAMAAACLLIGLGVGHVALPRTVTHTEMVVKPVNVPGPVREVPVERVVVKEVKVPVEVVRTVVKRVPTPVPTPTLVAETPTLPTTPTEPSAGPTLAAGYSSTVHEPYVTAVDVGSGWTAYGRSDHLGVRAYVGAALVSGGPAVSARDMRRLAARLRTDMGDVDRTLNTSELASTLVTDMGTAGAEMERSLRSESAAEGTH